MPSPPASIAHAIPRDLSILKPAEPHTFNPETDIPPQAGKVILITGGNSGIGKQTALELAKHDPKQIWILGRNVKSGEETIAEIQEFATTVDARFVECDLTSFESIKSAAKIVRDGAPRFDVLLLNAGILGGPSTTTAERYEIQFGTNHLGHALLLKLLTPTLLATANSSPSVPPRIIFTSSRGHKFMLPPDNIAFSTLKSSQPELSAITKYAQSKLANVIYARQFASHYSSLVSIAIHPEDVATELFNKGAVGGGPEIEFLAKEMAPRVGVSVFEGAKNGLWACTAAEVESGRYYEPVGIVGRGSEVSKDVELGKKLWEWTEEALRDVEP